MKKISVLVLTVLALAGLTACGSKRAQSGVDAEVIGVFVTAEPKKPENGYSVGDQLDLTGLELTVVYSDGRREKLSKDDIVIGESKKLESAGRKRITVVPEDERLSEGGRNTAYFFVDVASKAGIKSARITKEPKKEYVIGDKLDLTDIEVTVTYEEEGREDDIFGANDFVIDPDESVFREPGTRTVTLKIEDYELPFTVTVLNPDNPENPNETVTPVTPADEEQNKQNSGPSVTSIEVNPGSLET